MKRKIILILIFFLQGLFYIFSDDIDPRIWGFWSTKENRVDTFENLEVYTMSIKQVFPAEKTDNKDYIGVIRQNAGYMYDVFCITRIKKQSYNEFLLSMYSTDYYQNEVFDSADIIMRFRNNNTIDFSIFSKSKDGVTIFDIVFEKYPVRYRARATDKYVNYFLDSEIQVENFTATHRSSDRFNLHNSPDISGIVITTFPKDIDIQLLETDRIAIIDGVTAPWVKVLSEEGYEGWCFSGYLEPIAAPPSPSPEPPTIEPYTAESPPLVESTAHTFLWIWIAAGGAVMLTAGAVIVIIVKKKKH